MSVCSAPDVSVPSLSLPAPVILLQRTDFGQLGLFFLEVQRAGGAWELHPSMVAPSQWYNNSNKGSPIQGTGTLSTLRCRLKPFLRDFAWTITWLLCPPRSASPFLLLIPLRNTSLIIYSHRAPCLRAYFWGSWLKMPFNLPFNSIVFAYRKIYLNKFWVNLVTSDLILTISEFLPSNLLSLLQVSVE